MTENVKTQINEQAVVRSVQADLVSVFRKFGQKVRARARGSMRPQGKHLVKGKDGAWKTVWNNDTPKGEPPRVREGYIKHYINAALDGETGVVIGPEALPRHGTECLARLEHRDHPFMRPAFEATMKQLPQIWADVIGGAS